MIQTNIKNKFLVQAARLGGLALVSSALGFCREILIARYFGATHITDSYLVAVSVPMLAYALFFGSGLNVSLVPRLTAAFSVSPSAGQRVFAQFLGAAAFASLLVSCLILFFPSVFAHAVAPGIANSAITTGFVRSLSPLLFLFVLSYAFGSFHCARQKASHWGLVTVVQNATLVVGLLLLARMWGYQVLIWGTIIGAFVALVVQAYIARQDGFRESWLNAFHIGEGQQMLLGMVPFALAFGIGGDYGTGQADIFLIRFFASRLEAGSITLLALGNKIMALPVHLIGASMGVALLSPLSKSVAAQDYREAGQVFGRALSYGLLLACPLAVLYFDLGSPLAHVIFRKTLLAGGQVEELGRVLRGYSGAVLGLVVAYIANAYLAAFRRKRALIGAGIVTVAVDALLMWLLRGWYQSTGIAMAVSIGSICYSFILIVLLRQALDRTVRRELLKQCGLVLAGGVAMHVVLEAALWLNVFADVPWLGKAVLPALAGFVPYVGWLGFHRSRLAFEFAR